LRFSWSSAPIATRFSILHGWYNPAVTPEISQAHWETFLAGHTEAHLLQTSSWAELKSTFGWSVKHVQEAECGAQILFRHFPLGFSLAYIPKGPIGPWLPALLPALDLICRAQRAFALKIEPDGDENPATEQLLRHHGFYPSPHGIQPRRTLVVDLRGTEEEVLARMHQKTRYNIRLATRKDIHIRAWDDLDAFGTMMQETARRDGFSAHATVYYRKAYELFKPLGKAELLVAEFESKPIAALMAFAHGWRAWYLYGASSNIERNRMPAYLLQWEAMRWARQRECTEYDLWGIPDVEFETLEADFPSKEGGLWGVYRFKRGFGGRLVRSIGAWDRPYHQPLYALYRWITTFIRER
jgi:peptidoglycan pentaglycine glycine transferase (the first glycine)